MTRFNPQDLERFLQAQEAVYPKVVEELRAGRKESHWMWYIFPQLRGLGRSATAEHFAIGGMEEARRYLAHPVLGPRLLECCKLLLSHHGVTAHDIFGYPDDLKLFSSMTLFDQASGTTDNVFHEVLVRYYQDNLDENTLRLLNKDKSGESQ